MHLQNYDTRKIQLTFVLNFICPKDPEEQRVMHSSSSNTKFTS